MDVGQNLDNRGGNVSKAAELDGGNNEIPAAETDVEMTSTTENGWSMGADGSVMDTTDVTNVQQSGEFSPVGPLIVNVQGSGLGGGSLRFVSMICPPAKNTETSARKKIALPKPIAPRPTLPKPSSNSNLTLVVLPPNDFISLPPSGRASAANKTILPSEMKLPMGSVEAEINENRIVCGPLRKKISIPVKIAPLEKTKKPAEKASNVLSSEDPCRSLAWNIFRKCFKDEKLDANNQRFAVCKTCGIHLVFSSYAGFQKHYMKHDSTLEYFAQQNPNLIGFDQKKWLQSSSGISEVLTSIYCAVPFCPSFKRIERKKRKMRAFQIPADPIVQKKWFAAIPKCVDVKDIRASLNLAHYVVCEDHFKADDFIMNTLGNVFLKSTAVPSRFDCCKEKFGTSVIPGGDAEALHRVHQTTIAKADDEEEREILAKVQLTHSTQEHIRFANEVIQKQNEKKQHRHAEDETAKQKAALEAGHFGSFDEMIKLLEPVTFVHPWLKSVSNCSLMLLYMSPDGLEVLHSVTICASLDAVIKFNGDVCSPQQLKKTLPDGRATSIRHLTVLMKVVEELALKTKTDNRLKAIVKTMESLAGDVNIKPVWSEKWKFLAEQAKLVDANTKTFSAELMKFAMNLHSRSPSAYHYLLDSNYLTLPTPRMIANAVEMNAKGLTEAGTSGEPEQGTSAESQLESRSVDLDDCRDWRFVNAETRFQFKRIFSTDIE